MLLGRIVEGVVRTDGRRVLAGLIRLTGDFDAAEDALQEAYARALVVWHREGVPATPGAWLNTVARRIAIDRFRRNRHTALPDDVEAPPRRVRGSARHRGRPVTAALHVLSSRAGARGAVRARASDAGRPDDPRDRARRSSSQSPPRPSGSFGPSARSARPASRTRCRRCPGCPSASTPCSACCT